MQKIFLMILLFGVQYSVSAQYSQNDFDDEKKKANIEEIFPKVVFDSLAAKEALAAGNATLKGVAYTLPRNSFGFKAVGANRILANQMTVDLFPYTPYFEEWFNLKSRVENLKKKKKKIVYMETAAYAYRLYCVTNERGEFTFPNMKPGKYILFANLNYNTYHARDTYTGSGYNNYGGTTNYYERSYDSKGHHEMLLEIVEVKAGGITKVKLNSK